MIIMEVDASLVGLIDERFTVIKRQHFPSYLGLLSSWRETLRKTEEWMVKQEQEFDQYTNIVIAQFQKGSSALQDHNYCRPVVETIFVPHYCSEGCWPMGTVVKSPTKYSSLSLPLLLGWQRIFMCRAQGEGSKMDTYYCAPCGRRLRSMEEVSQFLKSTVSSTAISNIFITNFTYDPHCSLVCPSYNAKIEGAKVFIPDVTCGSEPIPITCVNSLNSEPPEHFNYISHREIGPGVKLDSDPGFLVSCSCEGDCSSETGCECWQLTIQEAKAVGLLNKFPVGYTHGRLKKPHHSAIYECNPRCSCGPRCGNRVVQRGIEHHLQVFRTADRGWGLRTLRDIPAGSFICTYVGQIFHESTLENQGTPQQPAPISDEYFAELDYIEVMEHHKEGYESEVEMPSDREESASCEEEEEEEEDESFTAESIASSNVRESMIRDNSSNGSSEDVFSSSPLSITSLCSSTLISPIHSPPPAPPTEPRPSSEPRPLTTPPAPPLAASTTTTTTTTTKTPIKRPVHALPITPAASGNRSSHLGMEQRIRSPLDYLVPISPHRLYGMRTRQYFKEDHSYIIDAKDKGNIGRYVNHSCSPNMFVQNVFVDTHDLRFPWVAFFARHRIKALQELTWDYSYEVGSVEGKVIFCLCKTQNCRGRLL